MLCGLILYGYVMAHHKIKKNISEPEAR